MVHRLDLSPPSFPFISPGKQMKSIERGKPSSFSSPLFLFLAGICTLFLFVCGEYNMEDGLFFLFSFPSFIVGWSI